MKGYTIKYIPKNNLTRTYLNHDLFGRIIYRNYRGKKYAYYIPGMLDNVPYHRIMNSLIFVEHVDNLDINLLNLYGEINIIPCDRDETKMVLKTGKEHWEEIVRKKDMAIRYKRINKK